jgi:hypothetical protein
MYRPGHGMALLPDIVACAYSITCYGIGISVIVWHGYEAEGMTNINKEP